MSEPTHSSRAKILDEVHQECGRQLTLWGEQNHPDQYINQSWEGELLYWRTVNQFNENAEPKRTNWTHILLEEVFEALIETEPEKLKEELVQVAAVAVSWIEAIDRRQSHEK